MTILQGARHLLLRGKEAVAAEWLLLCACHNLRKLFVAPGDARSGGVGDGLRRRFSGRNALCTRD